MTIKTKIIEHRNKLLAVPAMLLASTALAAPVAATGIGATTGTLLGKIVCQGNVDAAGLALVAVGLGFVVYKGVESFFGDNWSENIKVIIGGLVLAVIGTQLGSILGAIGFSNAATACS